MTVKLGKHDLSKDESGSLSVTPQEVLIHPDWRINPDSYDADVALLILEHPIEYTTSIFPICLWNKPVEPRHTSGVVIGWGQAQFGSGQENLPREVDLAIILDGDCFLKNNRLAKISSNRTYCAGSPDIGKAVCSGDSGSGMFIRDGIFWYLRGIVSSSLIGKNFQCDVSNYSVFTNALRFKEWIEDVAARLMEFLPEPPINTQKEIVCFVTNAANYRPPPGTFNVSNIKPELCSTIVYNFAGLDAEKDTIKSNDPWQDLLTGGGKGGFIKTVAFKKDHPTLKVLLTIGGWNDGTENTKYSMLAGDAERRERFANNSADFLKKYGFDGLNIYWDYPTGAGGVPEDKENFALLIRDMKKVYKKRRLYLSGTVRAPQWITEFAYDIPSITRNLDAVFLILFDFKGSWDGKIGLPSPLRSDGQLNVESSIEFWLSEGAPPEKLFLGIPVFGKTFVTNNDGNIDDETLDTMGFQGPFVKLNGQIGYNEFCYMSNASRWITSWHSQSSLSISKSIKHGKTNVVIYDSPRSVANKVRFAVENQLGGVWLMSIDTDDYNGDCKLDKKIFADFPRGTNSSITEQDFKLLRAANEAMKIASNFKLKPIN